ncbi:CLUMA_CG012951, isoform A [Clunio marinus]|uniref:CLUMA_CG012951, isoform A n=1 Tax=Clunio marinus TaxID=568069 RepID=A0A1J1IHG0_9DIPT|nr:CLUMA_CG012951, isoform A [Clunio marinus]
MGYLTKEILNGFDKYKYSSLDTSPLSIYLMHPFWNWLVEYFPRWIAPNVMTFVGFLLTALNFVMLSYYDWSFYASTDDENYKPIPNWFWLFASINIFLAYTLDGIDGKQARRIGLSGPLGELFDHGLDSYSACLIPVCLYSVFGRGDKYSVEAMRFYYVELTILFNFHISHWEKYNTGVLYLPWGYDLAMWGSVAIYAVNYFCGAAIWKIPLSVNGLMCGHFLEFVLYFGAMSNLPMVFYNLYRSYKDKTGKMRSFVECNRPLIPLLLFLAVSILWAQKSPNRIIETDPRAVFLLTGTIFSNISCRLIVSQMSNTTSETFHWMTPILAICFVVSLVIPSIERFLLYALLVFTSLAHWHYGTVVVQQMCLHFNRICFGVGERNDDDKKN